MNRSSEYRDYLGSKEWRDIRNLVMDRSRGTCELCRQEPASQVHHVRYPKMFSQDHPDNLLALCDRCHSMQHGIRIKQVGPDVIKAAPHFSFSFYTKSGKEYTFKFIEIDGKAWVPICEVEKRLYEYHVNHEGRVKTDLTRSGRTLDTYAAAVLAPEYRVVSQDGWVWLRASGVIQIMARREEPVCQDFREQLGDWMESRILSGRQDIQSSQSNDSLLMVALHLEQQSAALVRAVRGAQEAKNLAHEANERAAEAQRKVDEVARRVEESTGVKLEYMTARLFLQMQGIDPHAIYSGKQTNAAKLGMECSKLAMSRGLKLPPAIQEGNYLVNQYFPKLLMDGAINIGVVQRNGEIKRVCAIEESTLDVKWKRFISQSGVCGLAAELARNCTLIGFDNSMVKLALPAEHKHLSSPLTDKALLDAIRGYSGRNDARLDIRVDRKNGSVG